MVGPFGFGRAGVDGHGSAREVHLHQAVATQVEAGVFPPFSRLGGLRRPRQDAAVPDVAEHDIDVLEQVRRLRLVETRRRARRVRQSRLPWGRSFDQEPGATVIR